MASIKVKFHPSTVADHEGTIFCQILHDRKQRQHFTDYHVFPTEWDDDRSMVTTTYKSERKSFILSIRERIRWDVERLTKIIRKLENNELDYTADDVIEEFITMPGNTLCSSSWRVSLSNSNRTARFVHLRLILLRSIASRSSEMTKI